MKKFSIGSSSLTHRDEVVLELLLMFSIQNLAFVHSTMIQAELID